MKENTIGVLQGTERIMVRTLCGEPIKDRKEVKELMVMLGFNQTWDQLVMANIVYWYGHVFTRGIFTKMR